jgi:hypothetical protein
VVTLHGTLPTFYLKQLAQVMAAQAPDVKKINNRIQVVEKGVRSFD